jgi:GH25 family lysozyme M1 (1,4-beta-N-acetylmuramidase)
MIEGFDVSKYQNPEKWDWAGLKRRGVKFMVARASYGMNTADQHFARYAELIRANGIAFGAYLFYRQVHSVETQLAVFEQQIEAIGGLQPGDLFPVLDMEENSANGDGQPKPKIFGDACSTIASIWRQRYGGTILYYSSYFPEYLGVNKPGDYWTIAFRKQGNYFHWLADYNREPGKPRTPYTDEMHLHQPKPRRVPEYANGSADVDYDVARPDLTDIEDLLIKTDDSGVSIDAEQGEDGTTDRPGGADLREGIDLIKQGIKSIADGLARLE